MGLRCGGLAVYVLAAVGLVHPAALRGELMLEPRAKQRLPQGGKKLYELCRMDHEPETVCVFREGEIDAQRARRPDTLLWQTEFDPMVYFWPVATTETVVAFFLGPARPEEGMIDRLTKALRRDGARHCQSVWRQENPKEWLSEPWGCPRYRYELLREWTGEKR